MMAVVRVPVAPVYRDARMASERVDEVLHGWQVEILSRHMEFCHISTDYGYQGFVLAADLELTPLPSPWTTRCISHNFADVTATPHVRGDVITSLPFGAFVDLRGGAQEYAPVGLAGGKAGYIRENFLKTRLPPADNEDELRQNLLNAAKMYLNTQYRWGGKTHLGIDCSGLTFMAYRLNGITIWRDAHHKEGFPLRKIPPAVAKTGDLLYFPGHVAMIAEDGRIIHSSHGNGVAKIEKLAKYQPEPLYACTVF
ncbi:MAG: C40 family peptidase [Defluviitaleaceae bacterium]|nr:C40 family peptidase [Defluviitaleaceae bacterium]